jgi:nucleoside-diphosphate-sugar epimerase
MGKVVVTGGAGFIGSHLVDHLLAHDHEVTALDNLRSGKEVQVNSRAEFLKGDIREQSLLRAAFAGIDSVIHLAAIPRMPYSVQYPMETTEVNVMGTANVLIAACEAGVRRVVFASSSSVYGNQTEMPLREDMWPSPLSPYGGHKLQGEVMCQVWQRTYGLETVALRFFNVYGSRFDPDGPYALVIGKFIKQRMQDEALTICGDGEQTRDFTHVSDIVRGCRLAIDVPIEKVGNAPINLGAGRPVSINRITELIGGPIKYIAARKDEPRNTSASIVRAQKILDWQPLIPLEQGIEDLRTQYS